ncbi:MAG: efflux RND transporter permease subunit [Lachnospiraceae bacterium]|jgi:multidrug efflux pump subunit AcrB|nr:efflux RND transporter permease subunit [Lachnospiraceae bacterium]
MLGKFSVRKPLTVLVGVMIVIVLGIVSFMNTTTDLLPSMDLPFSAIITTYVGATPEQVEQEISIPMEARMSTIGGIDTVQSISNEHISIMILQFTESTNMDSASLEIREALDMMSLPDGASRPITIKVNPEMLPIMTANVFMEGMTIDELSEFVKYEITPALEGIPGVAVVNLSGLVQNQLHVVIKEEHINAVNQGLSDAVAALVAAAIAEMTKQAETMITAQVEAYSETRIMELMMEGLSQAEAGLMLHEELPAVIEAITAEVMEALTAGSEAADSENTLSADTAIGLPADMLTVDTITGILTAQNFAMPAGLITEDDVEYMVRVGDRFGSIDEIKNMLIFDPAQMGLPGMDPIRLSDIADVFATDDSLSSYTRLNGNPTIMLSIQRQSEFSTADVSNAIHARMDSLIEENPELGFSVLMDQGEMIGIIVGSVLNNLLWGGLLAILILLLFLRDIRPTMIVAVSIPVSLMLAFTLMYFTGISLNMISMGGLALTVGMLVDNSIAVIENIFRMRTTTGRSAARAAVSGAKQMSGAITAATLTTIAMFVPIIFTQGITRQLFMDLGLTIAYALIASLIIALTVVPAASSVLLKTVKKEQEGKLFTRFVDGYEAALRFTLRFRGVAILLAAVAFGASLWGITQQGTEMFPPMDMGMITVTADMPAGSTFEETVEVAEEISKRVQMIADVETVGIRVGGGGMMQMIGAGLGFGSFGGGQSSTISMDLILDDKRSITTDELAVQIRELCEEFDLETDIDSGDGFMNMMTGESISLRVEGYELDDIRDTAIALADLVSAVDGTMNITDFAVAAEPELRVRVDKDVAMSHGLTVAQVFMAVNSSLTTPEKSLNMVLSDGNYEIVVSDGDFILPDKKSIENMQISTAGGYVVLSEIAELYEDTGFTTISRINRNRFVAISGEIAEGFNVGLVNDEIERLLEDFVPVGDSRIVIGGQAEAIADSFNDLYLMLLLGLVFTYLIMVAQFQSLLSPLIIMFVVPLAFTGGFTSLMITGMPLSVVAMIGLILLAGVSINNGIIIISRITQMRWEGMSKKDAIIDSARKRIRPILMTAISTICAMSVLALGMGEGTEMMQPMAVATIGGLLYATAMTLFIVPILYDVFHKEKDITKEDLDTPYTE